MGWIFSHASRFDLIEQLVRPQETERASVKVIVYALREDVLWSVIEVRPKRQDDHEDSAPGQAQCYIRCDLLDCNGGRWGHKTLDESAHPFYYSCPPSFLAMAPVQSAAWREQVLAYHAS